MLHRDDLITNLLAWTWGQCVLWNQQMNQFSDVNGREFQDFVHRTNHTVWLYINNRKTLDGSCSDHECGLALMAHRVFGHHVQKEQG